MIKGNRLMSICLVLAVMLLSWSGIGATPAKAADEYDGLRLKWKALLDGGETYSTSDSDIASRISSITTTAQSNWDSMNKNSGRTYLWSDNASTSDSSDITDSYNRLKAMTVAYNTRGSSLENNTTLKTDIINGLDWMNTNRYYARTQYSNWWDWEIGSPLALNDIVVLMYEHLTATQRTNYMNAVNYFMPAVNDTGANRVWKATVVGVRGVIVKDSAKLANARDGLSQVFDNVTSGDGFYADGSFIQHGKHPYTGGYGLGLLPNISSLVYLLKDSTWEVSDLDVSNIYQWVFESYEPLIYKGAMMDMSRGREISRSMVQDHVAGSRAISAIIRVSQIAPTTDANRMKSMIKYWIEADTFRSYYSDASIYNIVLAKNIVATAVSRGELVKNKLYPDMDRAVHLRPGFGFGISMFSTRIYNYESINDENKKGWYTGNGMTYLYNSQDLSQFSDDYWATVNPKRLPGITVDNTSSGQGQSMTSSKSWVGGASSGTYGVVGMELDETNTSLTAKKSWFLFDDEVVALGSGITSTDSRTIETIVENRKIGGTNALLVNGTSKSTSLGWSETMTGVNWAHLGAQNIGYYFPVSATVKGLRESRSGTWSAINGSFPDSTTRTKNYMTLWFDHGTNPTNNTYAYVLLPNTTSSQVSTYAGSPEISVLENSTEAQAVKETGLGVTGVNFWSDITKTVGSITSNKKASVLMRETATQIEVYVSDPTQLNTGTINIKLSKTAASIASNDPSITVNSQNTIDFTVNVSGKSGATQKIVFNK